MEGKHVKLPGLFSDGRQGQGLIYKGHPSSPVKGLLGWDLIGSPTIAADRGT